MLPLGPSNGLKGDSNMIIFSDILDELNNQLRADIVNVILQKEQYSCNTNT